MMRENSLSILPVFSATLLLFSVAKSYPTLCIPMDCSMSDFPVLHYVIEFAQVHVHWVSDALQPSYPLSPPCSPALNLSQHQGLFQCRVYSFGEAKWRSKIIREWLGQHVKWITGIWFKMINLWQWTISNTWLVFTMCQLLKHFAFCYSLWSWKLPWEEMEKRRRSMLWLSIGHTACKIWSQGHVPEFMLLTLRYIHALLTRVHAKLL